MATSWLHSLAIKFYEATFLPLDDLLNLLENKTDIIQWNNNQNTQFVLNTNNFSEWQTLIKNSPAFTACILIGVIWFLVISLGKLFYCCCRGKCCQGKQRGRSSEYNYDGSPKAGPPAYNPDFEDDYDNFGSSWQFSGYFHTFFAVFLSLIVLVGGSFIIVSDLELKAELDQLIPEDVNTFLEDTSSFVNGISGGLINITQSGADFLNDIESDFQDFGSTFMTPKLDEITEKVNIPMNSLKTAHATLINVGTTFLQVSAHISSMQTSVDGIASEVASINADLAAASQPEIDDSDITAAKTALVDIQNMLNSVDLSQISGTDMNQVLSDLTGGISGLEAEMNVQTSQLSQDLASEISDIKDEVEAAIQSAETQIQKVLKN